jgi:hypothetical protein
VVPGTVSVSIHDAFIEILVVVGVVVIVLLAGRDARALSMEEAAPVAERRVPTPAQNKDVRL